MLSLAPASFEEALAKAKIVEADLYPLASAVAPAWSASSQDPAVSAPRRRQRSHQQAQPAQASPETTPASSVPEPQLSYEALDFSTELLRTTEALQDLLQSTAVSQGSPVAGDPGVAYQYFELVVPPAAAHPRPDFLDAVASPLRSFLDSALHHGSLPADVLAQLDHCSAVLNGLQSALLASDSSLPERSCRQTLLEHTPDVCQLSEQPQMIPRSFASAEPVLGQCAPSQQSLQPLTPSAGSEPCATAAVNVNFTAEATSDDLKAPEQVHAPSPDCLPGDAHHGDAPATAASEGLTSCLAAGPNLDARSSLPDEVAAFQCADSLPSAPDASSSLVHVQARLPAPAGRTSPSADIPATAIAAKSTNPLPSSRALVLPCEPSSPAGPSMPASDAKPALPMIPIKAGRGVKMRQKLGTAAVVLVAGPSEDVAANSNLFVASTPPLSNSVVFVYNKNLQQHVISARAFGGLAQQCVSFDPGGKLLEPQNLSQGDGMSANPLICCSTGCMPGTGIVLVLGEGHEHVIGSVYNYHNFGLRSADIYGQPVSFIMPATATILQSSLLVIDFPVSAIVLLAALPSFTEPPDVG